jgi:undecaprenyl-diphosphatase
VALALGWRWLERNRASIARRLQASWDRFLAAPAVKRFRTRHPRASSFLAKRFARGEYLGLHLTVGFLISLLGLWAFAALTEDVVNKDPITDLDLAIVTWMRSRGTPGWYAVFDVISLLGSPATMVLLALAGGVLFLARRRWIMGGVWLTAFLGGLVLNQVLKAVIHRPRPTYASDFLSTSTWAFPSGHAMIAVIGYGMIAYVLLVFRVRNRVARLVVVGVAVLLIIVIGASRLYLGVHYFSDVLAGFAAGLLWLSACVSGLEVVRRWQAGRQVAP